MHKLTKRAIRSVWTDGRTYPDYTKDSLLRIFAQSVLVYSFLIRKKPSYPCILGGLKNCRSVGFCCKACFQFYFIVLNKRKTALLFFKWTKNEKYVKINNVRAFCKPRLSACPYTLQNLIQTLQNCFKDE